MSLNCSPSSWGSQAFPATILMNDHVIEEPHLFSGVGAMPLGLDCVARFDEAPGRCETQTKRCEREAVSQHRSEADGGRPRCVPEGHRV